MVGSHAERVVDIDDARVALGEALEPANVQAWIEPLGTQPGDLDDLRVDVDAGPVGNRDDARDLVPVLHLFERAGVAPQVRAQHEVEQVRRGRRLVLQRALQLLEHAVGVLGARRLEQTLAVGQAVAPEQVGERVRVGGDEVHRRVQLALEAALDPAPPELRRALVLAERAGQQTHPQVQAAARESPERVCDRGAQRLAQALHGVGLQPQRLGQLPVIGGLAAHQARPQLALDEGRVHLVPLDLVGRDHRDQVVDVRRARDVDGYRAAPVRAQEAASAARAQRGPARHPIAEGLEGLVGLAQHHALDGRHALGQPGCGVAERGDVRLRVPRAGVQAGVAERVRLLEGAHAHLAAAAQERVVRADVELDLVAAGVGLLALHALRER